MTTPADLLDVLRRQGAAPVLTWYGAELTERVELSGKALLNWVAKAGHLLDAEVGTQEGDTVLIDLPPGHWRAAYWTLAAWSRGATVALPGSSVGSVDVHVVADSEAGGSATDGVVGDGEGRGMSGPPQGPTAASTGTTVCVGLAVLARPRGLTGVIEEAAELPSQPDDLLPPEIPSPQSVALLADEAWSFADVVPSGLRAGRIAVDTRTGPDRVIRACLGVWASGGSVVLMPLGHAGADRVRLTEGAELP